MTTPRTIDAKRSATMRAVKSKNTSPELFVRRFIHSLGYRYSLHRKDLPGSPDLTFRRLRKVLFVHGCFWHGHDCLRGARVPKTNREYWERKIERNRERDRDTITKIGSLGWSVHVTWECELHDSEGEALKKIEIFLRS